MLRHEEADWLAELLDANRRAGRGEGDVGDGGGDRVVGGIPDVRVAGKVNDLETACR